MKKRHCTILLALAPAVLAAAPGDELWNREFGVPGANGSIYAMTSIGKYLYVGGRFSDIGGVAATNIARWNGTNWADVGGGVGGGFFPSILALEVFNGELYAGGLFSEAGGGSVNNIAKWDGAKWTAPGVGINHIVRALTVNDQFLIAGGTFSSAGAIAITNIASWDGTNWSSVGGGISGEAVDSVAAEGSTIYAGGRFRIGSGVNATNIAMWNGTAWVALGAGIRDSDAGGSSGGIVRALAITGNTVVAGGDFRLAGTVSAANIARWDGSTWAPLANGIGPAGSVQALSFLGSSLYAGGFFSVAGESPAAGIAKWECTAWINLGSGTLFEVGAGSAGSVNALWSNGSELFVGGTFTSAGSHPSTNIALWHIPHSLSISQAGDQVEVRWPATGTNLLLEAKDDLNGTDWSEVMQPPEVHNDECVVTESINATNRFYRLRRKPWE